MTYIMAARWADLPFCSSGNWEVVVARGEDTGHSIGFRYSPVTNISVGKGRWAIYVVLCAQGGVCGTSSENTCIRAAHEPIHVHTMACGRGGYELRPFARRCRPPRRGLAPARGGGHHGPQPVDRRSPGQAPGTAPFGLAAAHASPPAAWGGVVIFLYCQFEAL